MSEKRRQQNAKKLFSAGNTAKIEVLTDPLLSIWQIQNIMEITQILNAWNSGDQKAKERLMPFVYDELKRQASILMSRERSDHTLQPTALVHEAFVKISEQTGIDWKDPSHFYGIASHLMRQILIQHARKHTTQKRGNNTVHFSLDDVQVSVEERADSILALDEALEKLAKTSE